MPHIDLGYDRTLRLFWLRAFAALPEPWGHPPFSYGKWRLLALAVDTAAYNSALSSADAMALGVPVDLLPREITGGSTGSGLRPVLSGLFLRPDLPGLEPVRIPKVTILPADLDGPNAPQPAAAAVGGLRRIGALNLLGMDVLEMLRARLALDLARGTGSLRW